MFELTPKQVEAKTILSSDCRQAALYGGILSGKTTIIIHQMIERALTCRSKHLIVRAVLADAKRFIWNDTLPKVLKMGFPEVQVKWHKTDLFIEFPNGSQIWIAGLGGRRGAFGATSISCSTLFINRADEIDDFDDARLLNICLSEKNEMRNRKWYDFIPGELEHWTYRYFVAGIDPYDLMPIEDKIPTLVMNPIDNTDNISESEWEGLNGLYSMHKARLVDGEFRDSRLG